MAISSYPFDGQSTTEADYSRLFRELQDTGVVDTATGTGFKVTSDNTGLKVQVASGFAIVRGHAVLSTSIAEVTIAAADTFVRKDRIVLRLDPTANLISLVSIKGASGGTPPAVQSTDTGLYDLTLAIVTVGASVSSISAGSVADDRLFNGHRIGAWSADGKRPASPKVGMLGYNVANAAYEFYNGTQWVNLISAVAWGDITGKPTSFTPAAHSHSWGDTTGKPTTFTPSVHSHDAPSWSDVTGKPSTFTPATHSHPTTAPTWDEVTSKPTTFPASTHSHGAPSWSDVTSKPSTFTPATHTHGAPSWSDVTSKPTTFTPSGHTHDYASSGGNWGNGYVGQVNGANNLGLYWSAGRVVARIDASDVPLAPDSHTHSTAITVDRAQGSDRPHSNTPAGATWYAVWVDGNHNFCRNTSSLRYKKNVVDHNVDPAAVLALKPRKYDRKDTTDEDGNVTPGQKNEYGLIAEEVHETLPEIVLKHDGKIDSIRYDLLAVALLDVVKDQDARIAALEARL